jgi:hypothetical protein
MSASMRDFRRPHQAVWMSFAVVLLVRVTLTPMAHGETLRTRAIADNGFGDSRNSYAWSMAWFKGALYVGTARSAMCVERATIAYYLPYGSYYSTRPAWGVSCPPRIHEADLRAEIWRYSLGTRRWTRVYRSPTIANPRARGRRVARDIGYRGMAVLKEPGRREALYVGGLTANEFIPELARRHPPRILRTVDGSHFRALRGGPGVIRNPFGPRRPIGYRAMEVLNGALYVTASGGLTGDGVVLRVRDPGGSSPSFRQVSPRSLAVFELKTFEGRLYAGTGDFQRGYGVWQHNGHGPLQWDPVVTDGAGRGPAITSAVSMETFRGHLYVGANGWGTLAPAAELIRIDPDEGWEVVVGNQRQAVDGTVREPASRLPDGFGNQFNSHFWRMETYKGALLLGTNDWSWSLQESPALANMFRSEFGFDLYASCRGDDWRVVTRDGFGRPHDFGVRTMAASPVGLFVGTTNLVDGATILQQRATPCEAAARMAAVRPRRRQGRLRGVRWARRWPLASDVASGPSGLRRRDARRLEARAYHR